MKVLVLLVMLAEFVRAVYVGQRKGGEPLLEQSPLAGSQSSACCTNLRKSRGPEDVAALCVMALH